MLAGGKPMPECLNQQVIAIFFARIYNDFDIEDVDLIDLAFTFNFQFYHTVVFHYTDGLNRFSNNLKRKWKNQLVFEIYSPRTQLFIVTVRINGCILGYCIKFFWRIFSLGLFLFACNSLLSHMMNIFSFRVFYFLLYYKHFKSDILHSIQRVNLQNSVVSK